MRKFLISLFLIFIVIFTFAFTGCGQSDCTHNNLVHHEAAVSTCSQAGNSEYWECSSCKKLFADSEGKQALSSVPTLALAYHVWESEGYSDSQKTASGHSHVCEICHQTITENHVESEISAYAPTCTAVGMTAGKKCLVCGYVIVAPQEISKIPHDIVVIDATSPTCTQDGNAQYYYCETCRQYFSDEACTVVMSDEDVQNATIRSSGHTFDSLTIKTQPYKTDYSLGETLDVDGMVVTASCSACGGDEITVEDYQVENKTLVMGVNDIGISLGKLKTTLEVNVYDEFDLSANGSFVDFVYGSTYSETIPAISGTIEKITVGTNSFTSGFNHSGTTLTLDGATVTTILNGKTYGDFSATFVTSTCAIYKVNFSVVTKKLATAQDLADVTAANTAAVIDGYYIVTADIDASTAGAVRFVNNDTVTYDDNGHVNADKGFKGIFDGRGHVISNVTTSGGGYRTMGGLFGQFTTGGTVRNVAFTNVTGANGFLFSGDGSSFGGTVENVVITTNTTGKKVFGSLTGGSIKNFLVVGVAQINLDGGSASVSNVMSVTENASSNYGGFSWTGVASYKAQPNYASTQDMLSALSANDVLQSWNCDITYENGKIYFADKQIIG